METRDAIRLRGSIRDYLDRKVDLDLIAEILEIAKNSPSAGNLQNWQVVVVTDEDKRREISVACFSQLWMNKAPVFLVICDKTEDIERMYGERGKELYAKQNCAIVAQNILLMATDYGLASCWIGAFDENSIRRILKIPDNVAPEIIITLGYSDQPFGSTELKYDINKTTYLNSWGNKEANIKIMPKLPEEYASVESPPKQVAGEDNMPEIKTEVSQEEPKQNNIYKPLPQENVQPEIKEETKPLLEKEETKPLSKTEEIPLPEKEGVLEKIKGLFKKS
ncbi:nitroreductase family protein [Candidatus Woesearchaeota archaeon]|nr:nitroreductase family protein [Candidatus Woesearchaeota archaeon]